MMIACVLAPSTMQLIHTLDENHEEHGVCISKKEQHFHEYEQDCEFCAFHLTSFTLINLPALHLINFNKIDAYANLYSFTSKNTLVSFLLRGPPSFV